MRGKEIVSDSSDERPQVEGQLLRIGLLQSARRFGVPIPDGLMAVIFALSALMDFLTPEQIARIPSMFFEYREELIFVLFVEGGFLLMQGTLVDIATRLRKRPPIWSIPIIVAAVAIFSGESLGVLKFAWGRGAVVFLPLLISLAERGTMLWNMPNRSQIEKLAARALISNRIVTGLGLFGLMTLAMVAGVVFNRFEWADLGAWPPLAAGAIYFGVAAFDDWRVRGRRFAKNPRVLFGWDVIGVNDLAPL